MGVKWGREAVSLRLVEVRIPVHAVRGQDPRLECHFDLQGEALYSVKWYKDGNEFYRFVPRDMPPAQLFPLPGVAVDSGCGREYCHLLSHYSPCSLCLECLWT
uniref:Ig-like domain-containing protein n=1 Tax=Timema tahoe TaxID=61484 RepID=A0A7R9IRA9_9NEOP|nr:unnamed protein product [Timema tahoe]